MFSEIPESWIESLYIALILILITGCVELYEFKIENKNPSLVIEGQISNVSYLECHDFPAEGRYFTVKLSWTSNVSNVRDKKVNNAGVYLVDDLGNIREYTSLESSPGTYMLYDDKFHAEPGVSYQLNVILSDGASFSSDWERMPELAPGPMGNIEFEEVVRQQYVYRNSEKVLTETRGVNVGVDLPEVPEQGPVFYRWTFSATWVFRATLVSITEPDYRCWITNPHYLSNYVMLRDNAGGYWNKLFFLEVDGNDRIFDRISVLINQYAMNEGYYNYWTEIQEQDERTGLFDPPPFNLQSNLHAENPDLQVFGYFGVVNEQARRWNFSRTDLSYPVPNTWREFCKNPNILPAAKAQCYSCFNYGLGNPTNVKPFWWDE
jgi:hypothetical protein